MKYFGKAESFGEHADTYHAAYVRLDGVPTTMAEYPEGEFASDLSVTIASAEFGAKNGYPEKSIFPYSHMSIG